MSDRSQGDGGDRVYCGVHWRAVGWAAGVLTAGVCVIVIGVLATIGVALESDGEDEP